MNTLGLFGEDCSFYKDEPYRSYRPDFGIEKEDANTTWLTDHGRRIAFVYTPHNIIDLFEFFPGHQPRLTNPQKPPLYHAPTMLGARITLAQWVGAQGRTSDTYDLSIEETTDSITLTVTETWKKNRQHSVKRLALAVHPRFGYVLHTSDTIRGDKPVGIEVYNFLAQGLTHHHPEKRRFPLTVWHSPSRGLLKWTSNMVSLRCPGHQDREFARNIGTDGWLGFVGEADWNPIFALSEASQSCTLSTCDNLLDEHFCFAPLSTKTGNEYVLSCRGTLLTLPGPVADQLIERATFNDLRPDLYNSRLRTFCLNEVCDFEKPVFLAEYFRGVYWRVTENGEDWATINDEKVHSGRWSLRLRVHPEDGEKSINPDGSSFWLDTGRSYRLSAWVCYEGNGEGYFRLCASQAYMSFSDNLDPKESRLDATGATEWKCLELTFTALQNTPCVFIQLKASGDGKWFVDDVLLEQLS